MLLLRRNPGRSLFLCFRFGAVIIEIMDAGIENGQLVFLIAASEWSISLRRVKSASFRQLSNLFMSWFSESEKHENDKSIPLAVSL